nr:OmpA family protein [Acidobacteriota bacterium]
VKESDTEIRIEMSADVLFDFDRADIKKEAKPSLEKVADIVREHSRSAVSVEGHTDGKGSAAYNQALSERRAGSVARWLKGQSGLKSVRVNVRGFGASKPVASNTKPDGSDDPDGRQKNRRVEIVVGKK